MVAATTPHHTAVIGHGRFPFRGLTASCGGYPYEGRSDCEDGFRDASVPKVMRSKKKNRDRVKKHKNKSEDSQVVTDISTDSALLALIWGPGGRRPC